MYAYITRSLAARDEHRPIVLQGTVSRKAFGPQTGSNMRMEENEEKLRELYCRTNMVRGLVARMGDTGGACRVGGET